MHGGIDRFTHPFLESLLDRFGMSSKFRPSLKSRLGAHCSPTSLAVSLTGRCNPMLLDGSGCDALPFLGLSSSFETVGRKRRNRALVSSIEDVLASRPTRCACSHKKEHLPGNDPYVCSLPLSSETCPNTCSVCSPLRSPHLLNRLAVATDVHSRLPAILCPMSRISGAYIPLVGPSTPNYIPSVSSRIPFLSLNNR